MKEQIISFIQCLLEFNQEQRHFILKTVTNKQLKDIIEIIYNAMQGICPIISQEKVKLQKYKSVLRSLIASDISIHRRRQLLLKVETILPVIFKAFIRYVKRTDLAAKE